MSEKRIDIELLGKKIGSATGWDQVDDDTLGFYDPIFTSFGTQCGFRNEPEVAQLTMNPWGGVFKLYRNDDEQGVGTELEIDWRKFHGID